MSMKTLKTLLWSLLCLTFVVSCGDDPVEPGKNPNLPNVTKDSKIELDQTTITVSVAGGDASLGFTIQNPHANTELQFTATEDWVYDFNTDLADLIRFKVKPNPTDSARECMVTVEYRFANPVVFSIIQNAKLDKGFTVANVTSTYFDYTVDVIPDDKSTPYIVMSASPDYILKSGIKSPADLYEDDMAYFEWLGQFHGKSAVEVMQDRGKLGDQKGINVPGAAAGVDYVFYCYYFDWDSGTLLSDVQTFIVPTAKPAYQNVTFKFDVTIDQSCAITNVVPEGGYEGDYYVDVLPKVLVEDYMESIVNFDGTKYLKSIEDMLEFWWHTGVQEMMVSMSGAEIVSEFTCKGTNGDGSPRSAYDFELLQEVEYYIFAYAMDEYGLCASKPQYQLFKTKTVLPSNNVIVPTFEKITSRTAKFTFTPENDDYYVAGWEKASDWATFGSTDTKIQNTLLGKYAYELLKGTKTLNVLDLESDTEYVLYAFGSRGGIATTDKIFTTTFKTKSGEAGNVTISFKNLEYYDAGDFINFEGYEYLANLAGSAILRLEVVFSSEDHGEYFFDIYDWTGRKHEVHTNQDLMDHYVWAIDMYGGIGATHTYSILEFGKSYELSAIVLDTEGQFSSIYRQWVEPTYNGCGDPKEYVAWWNAYQASLPPIEIPEDDQDPEGGEPVDPMEPITPEEGEEQDPENPTPEEGEVVAQSLVIDNNNNSLFKAKTKANKVSNREFEAKQVTPAIDEVVAR